MRTASGSTLRVLVAIALLLLALTAVAGGSAAADPELSGSDGIGAVAWTPLGLRDGKTTVVVKLAGDPVAVVQSKKGQSLSAAEKQAVKAQLKSKQDGLKGDIQKLGGTVLADYQSAYNGIKVSIDRANVGALAELPDVVAVRPLQVMQRDNTRGVPMIGAPGVWDGVAGLHGENIKVAVIDTGIDYTHANFGGPGTVADFERRDAADTLPAIPSLFGPGAARQGRSRPGRRRLQRDAGRRLARLVPHPDPNPLDCNGHGSHVAGSAAGSGVLADGSTYAGPYNATTIADHDWKIGPGVAPEGRPLRRPRLRLRRLDRRHRRRHRVGRGQRHGRDQHVAWLGVRLEHDPSAEASTNAADAGIIVVTSAGNSGPNQYITGSPGVADGAIATAAIDPAPDFPGASIAAGDVTIDAINANGTSPRPAHGALKVIPGQPGDARERVSGLLGRCLRWPDSLPPNTIAVVNRDIVRPRRQGDLRPAGRRRGSCHGQQRGWPAAVRGEDHLEPGYGTPFTVTIPFLGVPARTRRRPPTAASCGRPDGTATTLTPKLLTNPGFKRFASFSSGGPRRRQRAEAGHHGSGRHDRLHGRRHGQRSRDDLGYVDGVPARRRCRCADRPGPSGVERRRPQARRSSTPASRPASQAATGRAAVARVSCSRSARPRPRSSRTAGGGSYDVAVNFGFAELSANFTGTRTIQVKNNGSASATFNLTSAAGATSSPHTLNVPSSITVPAGGSVSFDVTLNVPASTVGASSTGLAFREVVGLILLDATSGNGGVDLRVPYYLVPRALSKVDTTLGSTSKKGLPEGAPVTTTATITNPSGYPRGRCRLLRVGPLGSGRGDHEPG